ncbi:kinase [Actinomyces sp. B33]|uniref:kinase n=1 Tax=Actinomyces sp. B33 TaxID=2942131 RepID=UPI00234050EF|nr:kinase [Actinomyces sp. B33]MDC4232431.1 kinase [Actinomyces sp. B33]
MHALIAGLTTLDVLHTLDHRPDPETKTTSVDHALSAGGPATNAAVTVEALERLARTLRPRPAPAPRPEDADHDEAPASSATLLTAIGTGPAADLITADLAAAGVTILDAASADSSAVGPAISSIIEHPDGRMVASTNSRTPLDPDLGARLLDRALPTTGAPDVVLVDGHNPELARAALLVGVAPRENPAGLAEPDPFALVDAKPDHLRVLDGGSWKDWFTPLLPLVDVAIVSADFCPPLLAEPIGSDIADFLRGFGITRTIRTRGALPIHWWWDGADGEVPVEAVDSASTLGAGDVLHGALTWALGRMHEAGAPTPADPTPVIAFASAVATASTRTFGTRRWRDDPALADLVGGFLDGLAR